MGGGLGGSLGGGGGGLGGAISTAAETTVTAPGGRERLETSASDMASKVETVDEAADELEAPGLTTVTEATTVGAATVADMALGLTPRSAATLDMSTDGAVGSVAAELSTA